MIRLIPVGGNRSSDVIEDLDLHHVPMTGDTIVIEYERGQETKYMVKGRQFFVAINAKEDNPLKERIALEVVEVASSSYTLEGL